VPTFLARDLPGPAEAVGRRGSIAQADVHRAELDALYSVTFCYLSAKYGRRAADAAR